MRLLATPLAALAVAGSFPHAGVLVVGKSLGGLRLGMTPAQVTKRWGSNHGVCQGCPDRTWYYNYAPFTEKGAGVAFRSGRVAAVFTLWQPSRWRERSGLLMGEDLSRLRARYKPLKHVLCRGYETFAYRTPGAVTDFYAVEGRIWGFGLRRPGVPACR
jgi:hypothetical protein